MKYTKVSFILACLFWVFDSWVHRYVFGEPRFEWVPGDFNELWMRTTIFGLVLGFGSYVDLSIRRLRMKETEKRRVFVATMDGVHHIMNNFLNQMLYFRLCADQKDAFPPEVADQLEEVVFQTAEQLERLASLVEVDEERIKMVAFGTANTTNPQSDAGRHDRNL